jgi:sugar diacid utilization regulator
MNGVSANAENERGTSERADLGVANVRLRSTVAELEGVVRLHEMLGAAVAGGAGEQGIADVVHELTGMTTSVNDRFGNISSWSGPGPEPPSVRRDWTDLLAVARRAAAPVRHRGRLVALAQRRGEVLGALAVEDSHRTAGPVQRHVLEVGTAALTLELVHARALADVELRLRRDLLDDLLDGRDPESALARGDALGHDLRQTHQVVVVQAVEDPSYVIPVEAVARAMADIHSDCLVGRRSERAVMLGQRPIGWGADRSEWRELHVAVRRRIHGLPVAIGVGGPFTAPDGARHSYQQACAALTIRRNSQRPDGLTAHEELGVYRVLDPSGEGGEIELFVQKWLGALLEYDARHRTDLIGTLVSYLECGGNYDLSARTLTIHRSTLRYRLKRIREVTDFDLSDVDQRLNMHLATRALTLMRG